MKISRDLFLVIPLEREDGTKAHVHAAPVSMIVFEQFHMIMAQTFTEIFRRGLSFMAGPRVAASIMRDIANREDQSKADLIERGAVESTAKLVETGLIREIHRNARVVALTNDQWQTIPMEEAMSKDFLDAQDVSEVENAIVFFSVVWRMSKRAERKTMMDGAAQLWGGSMSSLNITEFAGSLPISTTPVSSGASPAQESSVIS